MNKNVDKYLKNIYFKLKTRDFERKNTFFFLKNGLPSSKKVKI